MFISVFFLQRVSEKVGGAEGTKLDYDFTEMEKASSPCTVYQATRKTPVILYLQFHYHQFRSHLADIFIIFSDILVWEKHVGNRVPSAPKVPHTQCSVLWGTPYLVLSVMGVPPT